MFNQTVHKIKGWYSRYERHISSVALVGGFVWNALFLKRVDLFLENFWVIFHLIVIGGCILGINRFENERVKEDRTERKKIHFWLVTIMQFTFGGLLSTYLIFYFRSTTLSVSWPFILILAAAFIANERFKHHYDRLVFQISLYYLAIYSFTIFFIPVIVKSIGTLIFISSGVAGLGLMALFVIAVKYFAKERFRADARALYISICAICAVVNILYFCNIIPPIPLSLKDGGVYHSLSRNAAGEYVALDEAKTWRDYFAFHQSIHLVEGEPVYAYSAIFSPAKFQTALVHEWQEYDDGTHKWVTKSVIALTVLGGREDGYRTYSKKSTAQEGKWRITIKTKNGAVVGRLRFDVSTVETEPSLVQEIKD